MNQIRVDRRSFSDPAVTPKQRQYLAFIYAYTQKSPAVPQPRPIGNVISLTASRRLVLTVHLAASGAATAPPPRTRGQAP
jgi:hypothetical protein